jgi:hypothetical protein
VVRAVFALRPLSVASVAESESVRSGEVVVAERQRRKCDALDWFFINLFVEVVQFVLLIVLS